MTIAHGRENSHFAEANSGLVAGKSWWRAHDATWATMTTSNSENVSARRALIPAIVVGGLLAGLIDGALALNTFGWDVCYGIASGLLGSKAFPQAGGGGPGIWTLGLVCHFLVALFSAAIYCTASRWLTFLPRHFLFGAVVCGVGVYLVMNLIVLPLSAVPFPVGPFTVEGLRGGLLVHLWAVGLPIALSLWFFVGRTRPV